MKAIFSILFALLFSLDLASQSAAETSCFDHFQKEGEAALARRRPNFELARKKFAAAKECAEASYDQRREMDRRIREVEERNLNALEAEIDKAEFARAEAEQRSVEADSLRGVAQISLLKTENALKKADSLRTEAQKAARRALANDLAFKAQTALRDGDRTTAFRLAEMSWRFVDPGNQRTEQALVEIFFQNERTKNARPLSWKMAAFTLDESETPNLLKISPDGRAVAASTGASGSVRLWEIESGRELFSMYETEEITSLAVSEAGRFLVIGDSRMLRVWEKNGPPEPRDLFEIGNVLIVDVRIATDGTSCAVLFEDHSVIFFDLKTGAQKARFGDENGDSNAFSKISADGKKLFLISKNGHFQVIDLEKGQIEREIETGSGFLLAVALAPDANRCAISRPDRSLQIWDFRTQQVALDFRPEALAAHQIFFSPDGKNLIAEFTNGDQKKWDATTGELLERKKWASSDGSFAEEYSYAVDSPDGRLEVRYSGFAQADVFDVLESSAKPIYSIRTDQLIQESFFSPDSRSLLVVLQGGGAQIFEAATGHRTLTFPSGQAILRVDFAADGRSLALARDGGGIEIWSTEAKSALFPTLENEAKKAETEQPRVFDFLLSPDGKNLVESFAGDSVQVRSTDDGRLLFSKKGQGANAVFSPDGQTVAFFYLGQPSIWAFDAATGALRKRLEFGGASGVFSVLFSPDGRWFEAYSLADSSSAELFDGAFFDQKKLPKEASFVAFSPKKDQSALVLNNWSAFETFDLEAGTATGPRLFFDPRSLTNPRFSPTGDRFFCLENGRTQRVFEMPSAKLVWQTEGFDLRNLTWSADGERLVSADFYMAAWDARTGKLLYDLPFEGYLNDLSPDGNLVVSIERQRDANVFDAATGQKMATLRGRGLGVRDVRFSPDSRRIAMASEDGSAEIWDAQSGRLLFVLQGDTTAMDRVFFCENSSKLAIFQSEKVKIWSLGSDLILEKATASGPIAPLGAEQIADFLSGETVFESADWEAIRSQISPAQALELARYFRRQADLGRTELASDRNFGLAEQFFQSALNALDSPSLPFELADLNARWMDRALQSGRREETQRRARSVEKLLRDRPFLPIRSKLDLAQALTVLGKKAQAKALFSEVYVQDTAIRNDVLYQIEQNSRGLNKLENSEYDGSENLSDSLETQAVIGDAANTEAQTAFESSLDLFNGGDVSGAIKAGQAELNAALGGHLDYPSINSAGAAASAFGNLSFYLLFEKRFEEARQMAEFGAAIDSSQAFILTNLAHANLFLGKTSKAMSIYSSLKNVPDPAQTDRTFGEVMIDDLEKLAEKGIRCRDVERAIEELRSKGKSPKSKGRKT